MTQENITFHILLQDEWLAYEFRELVRLFVGQAHIDVTIDSSINKDSLVEKPGLVCDYGSDDGCGTSWLKLNDETIVVAHHPRWRHQPEYRKQAKRGFLLGVYRLMKDYKPTHLPWGTLTGVRPVKLAHQLLRRLKDDELVINNLQAEYAMDQDKARLVTDIAHRQRPFLRSAKEKSVSLYIGIPLCPSRCSYCSFMSLAVSDGDDPLIGAYLEALVTELNGALDWLKKNQRHIDTLYIGGGTPSVLSAEQIGVLMETLTKNWPLATIKEITFEAGRPDTITAEKLEVLKSYPVSRISINPQTMEQGTLDRINRQHTVERFTETWKLAKDMGFETINLDLILGLPGEGEEQLINTLKAIEPLAPANLTLHTLALKRSATLKTGTHQHPVSDEKAAEMMNRVYAFAKSQGLAPYYLYRQKEMTGNLENVGFAQPGKEGIYNILMMEEKQTIMGIGAGAVSKIYFPENDRIQRKPNVKNIHVYIERIQQHGFDAKGWNRLLQEDVFNYREGVSEMKQQGFFKRTHMCGTLREQHIDDTVALNGWVQKRRDLGSLIFVDLRDRSGIVQIIFDQEISKEAFAIAEKLGSEYVVSVQGVVKARQAENPNLATGKIEIHATALLVLNASDTPPIYIKDDDEVSEGLRLKYRYLDLRKPSMQRNLMLRQQVANHVRNYLSAEGFVEVETPVLTKPTPEGARDYLVPSRVNQGKFFALPQSPQLFKQLLMVSGMDRYFQIVKCFRDEDLRADRQPEFTQIDCEMSFVTKEDVMEINSRLMQSLFKDVMGVDIPLPFQRLSYEEAINRYGSDKPDLRYNMELVDLSQQVANCGFKVFADTVANGGQVKCLSVKGGAERFTRKEIAALEEAAKTYGAKGLAWIKVSAKEVVSPIKKFFSEDEMESILTTADATPGDLVLFVADKPSVVAASLGFLRTHLAKQLKLFKDDDYQFVWITDFPLLEYDEENGRYVAMHHPFTSPVDEDMDRLETAPGEVRAKAYDIVLNGSEIGGGSIRIHDAGLQAKMFKTLGLTEEETKEKFGFLLEAFRFGTPPHGGIAYGLDRLVMIMAGEDNIRQVIAFPKTQNAGCPLTNAPSAADAKQLDELGIQLKPMENKPE